MTPGVRCTHCNLRFESLALKAHLALVERSRGCGPSGNHFKRRGRMDWRRTAVDPTYARGRQRHGRWVRLGSNAIPAVGTGAPYVVERRFGVDRPEVMAAAALAAAEQAVQAGIDKRDMQPASTTEEPKGEGTMGRFTFASMTPEQHRQIAGKGGRRMWEAKTPAERAEHIRRMQEGRKRWAAEQARNGKATHPRAASATVAKAAPGPTLTTRQTGVLLGLRKDRVLYLVRTGVLKAERAKGRRGNRVEMASVIAYLNTGAAPATATAQAHLSLRVSLRPHGRERGKQRTVVLRIDPTLTLSNIVTRLREAASAK